MAHNESGQVVLSERVLEIIQYALVLLNFIVIENTKAGLEAVRRRNTIGEIRKLFQPVGKS